MYFQVVLSVIESASSWQWVNFLEAQCPAHKHILHINMDESFVPLWWPSKVVLVQVPAGGVRRQFLQQEQMATLATRRAGFTLMASVADDPAIQRLLPHIIFANKTVLAHAVFNALGRHLRGNSIFISRQSSWANADTLADFVRILAKVPEPLAQHRLVVVTLDACPVQLSER
jgi:hypothetical protein